MENDQLHDLRKQIDACILVVQKAGPEGSLAGDVSFGFGSEYTRSLEKSYTHLQEAKMWVGKCLEASGAPFPENLRDKAGDATEGQETSQPQATTPGPGTTGQMSNNDTDRSKL